MEVVFDVVDVIDLIDLIVNPVNPVNPVTYPLTMNEEETRAEHIDPALKAAGWGVVEVKHRRRPR